jgi:hypothetical protein
MTQRVSRRRASALSTPCAAALACVLLACSGGESEPAPAPPAAASRPAAHAAAPDAPAPAAATPTLEERLATLARLYVWDEARGEARAVEADVAQCHVEVRSEGLVGVAEHIRCMEGLGWKRKPGA